MSEPHARVPHLPSAFCAEVIAKQLVNICTCFFFQKY